MRYKKLIALCLGLVVVSTLAFSGMANAQSVKTGDKVSIGADQVIDSMLFAGGNTVDIAGTINGDVYCAGQTVTITATVKGDLFCAAQTVTVKGIVEGDARLAAQQVNIESQIAGSVSVGAQSITISKDAVINRDILGGAQTITISGKVGRDMLAGSMSLIIDGQIARDIKGEIDTIQIGSAGYVGGSLDYTGTNDPTITSGGQIVGSIKRTTPKVEKTETSNFSPFSFSIGWFIYVLAAMLLFSMILVAAFPKLFKDGTIIATKKPWQMLLIGTVAAIVIPVAIIALFISVIGIPMAIASILIWIVIIFLSGPFVAYLVGDLILQKSKNNKPILNMLVGGSVITVAFFIPILGFLIMFAAHLFGAGIILTQCKQLTGKPSAKKA